MRSPKQKKKNQLAEFCFFFVRLCDDRWHQTNTVIFYFNKVQSTDRLAAEPKKKFVHISASDANCIRQTLFKRPRHKPNIEQNATSDKKWLNRRRNSQKKNVLRTTALQPVYCDNKKKKKKKRRVERRLKMCSVSDNLN